MRESACQGSLRRRRHVNLHTDQMINWRLSSREATIDQSLGKWPAANGTERMQSHTGCICLTFPHGGFWKSSMEVTINQSPGKWQMTNHWTNHFYRLLSCLPSFKPWPVLVLARKMDQLSLFAKTFLTFLLYDTSLFRNRWVDRTAGQQDLSLARRWRI